MSTGPDFANRLRTAAQRLGAMQIIEPSEADDEAALGVMRLEQMFGGIEGMDKLRKRSPDHPAIAQYDGLRRLVSTGAQVAWPNEFEDLETYIGVLIDSISWAPEAPYGDIFEDLDEMTRGWVVPSLRSPKQYQDVMAELYFWGRFRAGGLPCELVEDEGMPDLVLSPAGDAHQCEVKRIHVVTKPRRIAELAKDANRKFKRTDPERAGSVLLSVARDPGRARLDERVPNDVEPYVKAAHTALRAGQYRNVAEILISWDEFFPVGRFPDPVLHIFIRRATRVAHPASKPAQVALDPDAVSLTIVSGAHWQDVPENWETAKKPPIAPRDYGDIVVTELFRSTSEFHDGIRAGHALEVIREPDCIVGQRTADGGPDVYLATRKAEIDRKPSTLLIFATKQDNEPMQVLAGFHLLHSLGLPEDLCFDAVGAFEVLLKEFGREVRIGATEGRFIRHVTTNPDTPIRWRGKGPAQLFALASKSQMNLVDHRWVFCVDQGTYRSSLAS
jgi:hypothetical protein